MGKCVVLLNIVGVWLECWKHNIDKRKKVVHDIAESFMGEESGWEVAFGS